MPIHRTDALGSAEFLPAGVAAVTGTIFARVVMGWVCDSFGPRFGHACLMLTTSPAVFAMALVTDATGFVLCRFFIGLSLATFVACQFWSSVMFASKVVGTANATGGGWGNTGGGVTQLVMPLIFAALQTRMCAFLAWRWAFFVPGTLQLAMGASVLRFGQDLPDGQYRQLRRQGKRQPDRFARVLRAATANYRVWCLVVAYGFSFGVELTMNNIVVAYFFDRFGLPLSVAGVLGSCFGLMNVFARTLGGLGADAASRRWGMRGRLSVLWLLQTAEGGLCLAMGLLQRSLAGTMAAMLLFSVLVQASEGATFAVVPFVSRRALGLASGLVGAGGNAGAALVQAVLFAGAGLETYEALRLLGVAVVAAAMLVLLIHFPAWGGILRRPTPGATAEAYYLAEYSPEEVAAGLADGVRAFAANAAAERGRGAHEPGPPPAAAAGSCGEASAGKSTDSEAAP